MALTNKTIAATYGDILQVENSGSGRTASGTVIKDGLGQSTSLTLGQNKAQIKPSTDATDAFLVEASDGSNILAVDTSNSAVKAGATQSYVNTQIKEFGTFDMSPTAGTHYPMVSMNSLGGGAASTTLAFVTFGTGTDPATTFTLSSAGEHLVPCYWYIPTAITLDEIRVIASADGATTLNFHLFSYTMATGTGSGAGDLSSGTLLAHNGSALTAGDDRITSTTLTVDSANVAADKVVLAFVENVGGTDDVTAQLIVKYHYQ